MKTKVGILSIFMSVMMILTGCGCSNGSTIVNKETKRKPSTGDSWTVMIYMSAGELEADYSRASEVLNSLSYDLPENINVVVEVGGYDKWTVDGLKNDRLQDFEVQKNGIRPVWDGNTANMGRSKTYADFLNRTMKNYPADKYISIIWGEGGGPISGVAHDMTNDNDSLTTQEIAYALASTETKLDMIAFDASLMSSLEVAAAIVPYVDYMVASEDIMPISGIDYRGLFGFLSENPDASAPQAGQVICDGVMELAPDEDESLIAMSVIDLSDITNLMQEFDTLSRGMAADVEDMTKLRAITGMIDSAEFMGGNTKWEGYSNLVDLESFQTAIYSAVRSNYARIKRAISKAVIYKSVGELHENSCGISVYYPNHKSASEINSYRKISTSPGYMEFIDKTVADDTIVGRTADYKTTATRMAYDSVAATNTITAEPDLNGKYILTVTNPDIIADTSVNLYKYDEEAGVYFYLSNDGNTYYTNVGNTYEYKLGNKQLELNKIPVSSYLVNDYGNAKLYSIPVIYKDELSSIRILCTEDETKKNYTILGVWKGVDKKTGMAKRKYVKPSSGDALIPIYETYGAEDGSYARGKRLTLVFGGLNIKERSLDDGEYLLTYTAEDIYGVKTESNTTNVTAIKGKMQITK